MLVAVVMTITPRHLRNIGRPLHYGVKEYFSAESKGTSKYPL